MCHQTQNTPVLVGNCQACPRSGLFLIVFQTTPLTCSFERILQAGDGQGIICLSRNRSQVLPPCGTHRHSETSFLQTLQNL